MVIDCNWLSLTLGNTISRVIDGHWLSLILGNAVSRILDGHWWSLILGNAGSRVTDGHWLSLMVIDIGKYNQQNHWYNEKWGSLRSYLGPCTCIGSVEQKKCIALPPPTGTKRNMRQIGNVKKLRMFKNHTKKTNEKCSLRATKHINACYSDDTTHEQRHWWRRVPRQPDNVTFTY